MDPIKITLNANINLLLQAGIDPSTSEGKAKIVEVLIQSLNKYQTTKPEETAIASALLAEV